MDESAIEDYIERSKSLIEDSPQMGEENTKVKLVQPLIELLGWDVYSSEVELEYPMQIGRGNTRADYALQLEGAPVVFVEAKGCDSSLSSSDRSQLVSYMRQKGVDWGLLTNGDQFEVLKRRKDSARPDEVSLSQFELEELDENWSVLRLLSRDLVHSGEADTIAQRIEARKRAVRILKDEKDSISEDVSQLIVSRVGDTLAQEIESESKEFVDNIIESLGTDHEADVYIVERGAETDEKKDRAKKTEYNITLYENSEVAQSFIADNQSDVMAEAIDFLIQKFDLIDKLDSFPYVPGEKSAVLNSEPRHPSGDEMRLYRELSDEYYLYVALNQKSKKRYVNRFSELCGLKAEFTGRW